MSKKVLVVDDNPDARETVRLILEAEGYEVIEACDGQMGVEVAQSSKPDLIVMDMMMPKKDGFVACLELKRDPDLSQTPIIMLSGIEDHVRGDTALKNVQSGLQAEVYMAKPIEAEKFIQVVSELLASREGKNTPT
jgi:CheY-like chemotaxis protein